MSEFNEERLTEILKAAGHDVYLADLPRWCRWRSGAVVAGYASSTTGWPMLIQGPDAYADPLGRASTYDEVLTLLAPLLPTATIPAIPLDAEHEARVEAHIRERKPAPEGYAWRTANHARIPAHAYDADAIAAIITERDSLREQLAGVSVALVCSEEDDLIDAATRLLCGYSDASDEVRRLRAELDRFSGRRTLKAASGRVLEVGGYGNRRIGATLQIGDRTHLFDLTEEEARRVAGYLYRDVLVQIVGVDGE